MNSTSPGCAFADGTLATISLASYCATEAATMKIEDVAKHRLAKVTTHQDIERLYDDPCELLADEWNSSPTNKSLPRSRSWLCCPQPKQPAEDSLSEEPPMFSKSFSCEYSNLITDPPRIGQSSVLTRIYLFISIEILI